MEVDEQWMRRPPLIQVCGVAANIRRDDKVFDVDAVQYVYALKGLPRENSVLPICTYFPDSPRFQNSKPMPSKDTYVSLRGILTRFSFSPAGVLERFFVELDQLAFLGKKGAMPFECMCLLFSSSCLELMVTPPVPTTPTPTRASKLKFSFDAKSPLSVKRRKMNNAIASSQVLTLSQDPIGGDEDIEYVDPPTTPL